MERNELHARTVRLIGQDGLDRLQSARVAVLGLGGVGGETAVALCRSGVGFLRLVDDDVVIPSNLTRQAVAFQDTVGMKKADAMQHLLSSIDPSVILDPVCERITPENVECFVKNVDFVADCVDDVNAKVAVAKYCVENGIPLVSSMGAGNKLDPSRFRVADLSKTYMDPLAKIMRTRLKALGIIHLPVVFSDEQPLSVPPDQEGRHSPASISFVPPACGLVIAGYIVRTLLNEVSVPEGEPHA